MNKKIVSLIAALMIVLFALTACRQAPAKPSVDPAMPPKRRNYP